MDIFGKNHFSSNPKINFNKRNKFYTKFAFILTFFFLLLTVNIQTTSADVISQNVGGSQEIAVTTDKYIEGFFSGIPTAAVSEEEEEEEPPGGGGGGVAAPNINVTPTEFNINLAVNTTTERTIQVRNLGTSQVTVSVTQSNLGSHVILENTSLVISAGQSVNLKVVFVALSEPGIFTGTINIGGKTVLVSLNVRTQLLLFDSNIVVLNDDFQVPRGEELRTLVTLIPLGDEERLDVTLNFLIKDYRNQVFLTKSETLLVDSQIQLLRDFDTGSLPLGDYVIGLELVYPNGVAPSSAHFQVITPRGVGKLILYLVSLILLILIIILIILIRRRLKKQEEAS